MSNCEKRTGEAWIQTYTGRRINLLNPKESDICLEDIAQALSLQCRFSGHCKKFYSVAQHSVFVSKICEEKDAMYGLLHDASEAYLVDLPKPLKYSGKFDVYLEYEHKMMRVIYQHFKMSYQEPLSVMDADRVMLVTEARDLATKFNPSDWGSASPAAFTIEAVSSEVAKEMFLKRYYQLVEGLDERKENR